jgi:type IVB pilus formation R64 PilN family outer membrane protein
MRYLQIVALTFFISGCVNHPAHKSVENKNDRVLSEIEALKDLNYGPIDNVIDIDYPPVDLKPLVKANEPAWYGVQVSPVIDQMPFGLALRTIFEGQGVSLGFDYDVDQKVLVSTYFDGTLRGWLDQLSLASGYGYSIEGNHVSWHKYITRTFDIKTMPGTQKHLLGTREDAEQQEGNSQGETVVKVDNDEYSSNTASLSVWGDLGSLVGTLISDEGKVFVSESSTSITVKDFPENVRAIETVINAFNTSLKQQVMIDAQILVFQGDNTRTDGINWDLVRSSTDSVLNFSNSFGDFVTAATGAPSRFSVTIPEGSDSKYAGTQVLLQALNEQGKAAIVTSPRAVTLNNQVAEIRLVTDTAYLASSSSVLNDSTAQTTMTPGVVTDGFTMYVLPKIDTQDQEIYLQFSTTLADLLSLPTVTAGDSSIQTPEVQKTKINSRTRLKNGETLIITGYKQTSSKQSKGDNFDLDIFTQKNSNESRQEVLVLLTPIIMD